MRGVFSRGYGFVEVELFTSRRVVVSPLAVVRVRKMERMVPLHKKNKASHRSKANLLIL